MLQLLAFGVMAFTMALLLGYLRLPDGRECPACGRRPLRRVSPRGEAGPMIPRLLDLAFCRACGWRGRIRRGPVHSPVSRRGRGS